jgi:uncharacterized protein (TIGR02466 family)
MNPSAPQLQVVPLFAAPLVEFQHPDPAPLNAELAALFLRREAEGDKYRNRLMTAGKQGLFESEFDLFKWPEGCVQRLKAFCFESLYAAVRQLNGYSDAQVRRLAMFDDTWFHVTRRGGYTTAHNHPMASWSGVYCVAPGEQPPEHPDSGVLRFLDPRAQAAMFLDPANSNLVRPFGFHIISLRLRPGQLVLFPSYLVHEVSPFMGGDVRITVAFNVWFRGGQ